MPILYDGELLLSVDKAPTLGDLLELLHPMDIIVTRDRTPLSWWIRWQTSSEWSHVCLAGGSGTIYTTAPLGFKHTRAEDYLKGKSFAVYRLDDLSAKQAGAGLRACLDELGKPYAYRDILTMFLQNFKGRGVQKLTHNSKNHFCAEQVAYAYHKMGVTLAPQLRKEPSGYTPANCVDDHRLHLLFRQDM